jgi:hypothetical protein
LAPDLIVRSIDSPIILAAASCRRRLDVEFMHSLGDAAHSIQTILCVWQT